jgi:N-methylhydantoinase A
MHLDSGLAEEAAERWGEQFGLDAVSAALTIVELAINEMETAIQEVSTRKGRDPRECVLVAFGGAGPAHAARLADLLEIPTVLCPHSPGVASTLGLLSADVRSDFVQSVVTGVESEADLAAANHGFAELRDRAWAALEREEIPEERRGNAVTADLRYLSQQYTVNVVVREHGTDWNRPLTQDELARATARFHETHNRLCGFDYREQGLTGVQLVNLRVAAIGTTERTKARTEVAGGADPAAALAGTRRVLYDEQEGFSETPIYERSRLGAGNVIEGPAVIDEFDSTTLVWPGHTARIDESANIVIETGRR